MDRQFPPNRSRLPQKVLHVVGSLTDEVYSFLGPATLALASAGRGQALIVVDDTRFRHHLNTLRGSAELVPVPRAKNPFRQWRAVWRACTSSLTAEPLYAVHLHGWLPWLVGALAVRSARARVPIYYSPHGSRSLGALRHLGALALLIAGPLLPGQRGTAIVNVPQETGAFQQWQSVELVESPVGRAFFDAPRAEAAHPLIVTGGRAHSAPSAELLAQLAVVLSGAELRVGFHWIGAVDEPSRARLKAANVEVFDETRDAHVAARLARGWVYAATGGARGFPVFLVDAMATGLPCVAIDCELHRAVIVDGETGYLCKTEQELVDRIAALIDSPALRQRIGTAARQATLQRFGEAAFNSKLLSAYGLG